MLECSTTWTWCPGLVWITGPCAAGCSPSRRTTARRSSTTTGTTHLMSLRLGTTSIKIKCRFTKISVIGLTPKGVESQKNWQNDHLFRTICGRKKCLLNIFKIMFWWAKTTVSVLYIFYIIMFRWCSAVCWTLVGGQGWARSQPWASSSPVSPTTSTTGVLTIGR